MATTYEQILGIEGSGQQRKPIVSPIPAIDPSIGGQSGKPGATPPSTPQPQTVAPAKPTRPNEIAERIRNNSNLAEARDLSKNGGAEQPEQTQKPEEKRVLSFEEMFRILNPEKPETPEDKAKRLKKEKREGIFAAISDGISALANLYFTTKGAPNAYDPTQGMSVKARERWDKLNALRDSKERAYNEGLLRAMQLDDANRKDERNWQHTIEREKISDERYEVKAAQDKAMADLNERLKNQQITGAQYDAEYKRIRAQYAPQQEKADLDRKKAQTTASLSSAKSSNARADYYRNGGSGGGKKGPTLQLEDDEPMHFDDDKDYDRTVMRLAPDYGVPTTREANTGKVVTRGENKGKAITKTVKRDVKDIAADIEREAAKRKKAKQTKQPNPMGGDEEQPANGKKKNPMS